MTARWPAPSQLPPAKPSPGKRTWGGRAKGRVSARGLSPAPSPAHASPRWPRTSTPHPNRLSLQETLHHRICFLGQSAPSAPPTAPMRGATTLLWMRSDNSQAQGAEAGGARRSRHTKGPLWSCRSPAVLHAHTGWGPGTSKSWCSGEWRGHSLGHLSCGLGQGSHSRRRGGGGSRLVHGPLQFSPGPSPPHRDERRPD